MAGKEIFSDNVCTKDIIRGKLVCSMGKDGKTVKKEIDDVLGLSDAEIELALNMVVRLMQSEFTAH